MGSILVAFVFVGMVLAFSVAQVIEDRSQVPVEHDDSGTDD